MPDLEAFLFTFFFSDVIRGGYKAATAGMKSQHQNNGLTQVLNFNIFL